MQSHEVRVLGEADRDALDSFLQKHLDQTMFLRFNVYRGGLTYEGKPGQSVFWGAFDKSEITSVLSISWNGYIQCFVKTECDGLANLLSCFLTQTGKLVTGINGVSEFTRPVIDALQLNTHPTIIDHDEVLMSLCLDNLTAPSSSAVNKTTLRALEERDAPYIYKWQLAYEIEALGEHDSAAIRERIQRRIPGLIERSGDYSRILEDNGTPVSRTGFSAMLPDAVMVAGVYTPPELRNKGYAKTAVYKSLCEVKNKGVEKAVLFTANEAAERAYKGIGFKPVGKFAFVNFAKPWQSV